MPGDPRPASGGFVEAKRFANRDADALIEGGVDGVIVENFGSAPFYKGTAAHRVPAHQIAFMADFIGDLVRRSPVPVGVNCLRNDAASALGIAAAVGAAFVRVNVHTGAYVTDQGIIEGEAAESLRYRDALGAQNVAILADVLVKHAAPLAPLTMKDAVKDTLLRGLADGVIVTGRATGAAVDEEAISLALEATTPDRLFVGSGLRPETGAALAPRLRGAIVGTWFKRDGQLEQPVDSSRVEEFAQAVAGLWAHEAGV